MIFKLVLSTFISICLLSAVYLDGSKADHKPSKRKDVQEVVIFDDDYKTDKDGNMILDDGDFPSLVLFTAMNSGGKPEVINGGSSMTQIMTDGFGNKIVMRFFYNHPLVAGIVSRVSSSGVETVQVFSKNGLMKLLPASFKESVMSVTGDELARQAEIYTSAPVKFFNPFAVERLSINDELTPGTDPDFYNGEYTLNSQARLEQTTAESTQIRSTDSNLVQKTTSQIPIAPISVSETKKPAPMSTQAVADDFKARQRILAQNSRTGEQTANNRADQ